VTTQPEPITPEQSFGQRLRDLRTARAWSQQKVADAMRELGFGWRQTTAAKTEAAERPVPLGEVVALAGLFGVGVHDLLDVPTTPTSEESALLIDYLAAQRRLARIEQQLAEAGRAVDEARDAYDAARGVSDDGRPAQG